jgi:hypothetical protein
MTTPKVFISYSHDSEEHKAWVADLARFLIINGIDVVIDAWNLRRGEDIPKSLLHRFERSPSCPRSIAAL